MSLARTLSIVFHCGMSAALLICAFAPDTHLYTPQTLTRLLCGVGAFIFGWEAWDMMREKNPT